MLGLGLKAKIFGHGLAVRGLVLANTTSKALAWARYLALVARYAILLNGCLYISAEDNKPLYKPRIDTWWQADISRIILVYKLPLQSMLLGLSLGLKAKILCHWPWPCSALVLVLYLVALLTSLMKIDLCNAGGSGREVKFETSIAKSLWPIIQTHI